MTPGNIFLNRAADDYRLAEPRGRKVFLRSPGIYSILYPDYAVIIDTLNGTGRIDPESLEARLERDHVPRSHIIEAKNGAKSLNTLDDRLKDQEAAGTDADLRTYLRSQGYRDYPVPKYAMASNRHKGAVAFTDGQKIIGVNTDYEAMVSRVAKDGGMDKKTAYEYIVSHEKTHMAQPKRILQNKFHAELDVELKMADHFYQKAQKVKEPYRSEQYRKAADYALSRASQYLSQVGMKAAPSVDYRRAA